MEPHHRLTDLLSLYSLFKATLFKCAQKVHRFQQMFPVFCAQAAEHCKAEGVHSAALPPQHVGTQSGKTRSDG